MAKQTATDDDRLAKAEKNIHDLKERCLQLERLIRVLAWEHKQRQCTNEESFRGAADRANHFTNAYREIKGHLKKFGNEFDREPHIHNQTFKGDFD